MKKHLIEFTEEELNHICMGMVVACRNNDNQEAVKIFKNISNKAKSHLSEHDKKVVEIIEMIG